MIKIYVPIILLFILVYLIRNNVVEKFSVPKNVIMTTYFCKKKDPQRDRYAPCNDLTYIKPWYNSIKKLQLNGIVFHDGLSNEFIDRYQTTKIKFIYLDSSKFQYSLNDQRFLIYYDFLNKNKNIEKVFMTDGNDVTIVQNPFEMCDRGLCIGSELVYLNFFDKFKKTNGMKVNIPSNYNLAKFRNKKLLNAGIIGGNIKSILKLLKIMCYYFSKDSCNYCNLNMAILNQSVYNNFNNIITGYPLHSRFLKYENNRKDVYFIHK